MRLFDLNPYVRFARVVKKAVSRSEIVGLDNRLFFCVSGSGEITVSGRAFPLSEGAVLLIRAGTPYKNTSQGEDMRLYAFNFDFVYSDASPVGVVSYVHSDTYHDEMLVEEPRSIEGLCGSVLFLECFYHREMLERIIAEEDAKGRYYAEISSAAFREVLLLLARELGESTRISKGRRVLEYVREHYREPLTNESIAQHFSYHKNYINALIKKETGTTLHSYLLNYRIERAADLLVSGEYSVSEAGALVGFVENVHFSRAFKKLVGKSPSQYLPKRKG